MAKNVSAIVSGAGWIADFAGKLINGLRERGCSDEEIHGLVTSRAKLAMAKIVDDVSALIRQAKSVFRLKLIRQAALRIGGVAKDDLMKQLEDGGHSMSSWARNIMSKSAFTILPKPTDIELGWSTVRDLGFDKEPTTDELFRRIKEVGDLCPAEVGPHLRLVDKDQPRETWYWVAMEPIADSDGYPCVFFVGRDGGGGRWLRAFIAGPGGHWGLGGTVVFVLRK